MITVVCVSGCVHTRVTISRLILYKISHLVQHWSAHSVGLQLEIETTITGGNENCSWVYHHHHLRAALPVPCLAYPYDREAESQCALGPVCSQLQGFLPKHVKPLRRGVRMIQLAPL